ncbi:MAG TPA: hypothetical protein VNT51_02875 [Miltoncostaeaceae bacterium]|nr:hypothetical protein [Miltoncostaeaceae bacterium]
MSTTVATTAAVGAALAFGVAAALQGAATRRVAVARGLDPRLLGRLLRQPLFLAALALTAAGFALQVVALQRLPLFLAQSVVAASLAVTAVAVARMPGLARTRVPVRGVAAVCAGLVAVSVAAVPGPPRVEPDGLLGAGGPLGGPAAALAALLGAVLLLAAAAALLPGPGTALGLLAGVGFGVGDVAARLLPGLAPADLRAEPLVLVVVASGAVGFLLWSTAMQRGTVVAVTAAMVATQTAVPAVAGVVALGDRVREGWLPAAAAGTALALAGVLHLARAHHAGQERRPGPGTVPRRPGRATGPGVPRPRSAPLRAGRAGRPCGGR